MTPAELATGYNAYTDQEELRGEVARQGRSPENFTTTVLTTSLNCG
jgi:hypothetical protein